MRAPLLALAVALAAAPAAARADPGLDLRLRIFDGAGAAPSGLALDVPDLSVRGLPVFEARRGGGGGGARVEPALCLVLGIIPGFGIGHLLAGSQQWTTWLIVDIIIAFVAWGPFFYWNDRPGYFPLLNLLVLVERIFEGISAYQAAGGGPLLHDLRGWDALSPSAVALPVGARGSRLR